MLNDAQRGYFPPSGRVSNLLRLPRAKACQLAFVLIVVTLWACVSLTGEVSPLLLPPPTEVALRLWHMLGERDMWHNILVTVTETGGSFLISLMLGMTIGVIAARTNYSLAVIQPVLGWLQIVPIILFYPIMIFIFGVGMSSKIAFAGIYGSFPVAQSTILGFTHVDSRLLKAARSLGGSRFQMLWHVRIPAASPTIVSGIRLAAALNLIGVLAAEILTSTEGIGYEITASSQNFEPATTYAYMIVAICVVAIFNTLVTRSAQSPNLKRPSRP
jgi:ABC-type nitrate/sulfonate/bicarbonate transport system permease component